MRETIVVADTSCLIALSKIEAIDLLEKLYQEVYITEEIAKEFGDTLSPWIKIERVKIKNTNSYLTCIWTQANHQQLHMPLT